MRELELLNKLISEDGASRRQNRYLASELVDPPFSLLPEQWQDWCATWAFHVPPSMATALDIQLTQKSWTEEIRDERGKRIPLTTKMEQRLSLRQENPNSKKLHTKLWFGHKVPPSISIPDM